MSLASGSFWPKAAISPNLQVPARIFCMGWVFCTYRKLIYRKPELGGDFRSLSPPCPTELRVRDTRGTHLTLRPTHTPRPAHTRALTRAHIVARLFWMLPPFISKSGFSFHGIGVKSTPETGLRAYVRVGESNF